jgi:hypothetical protein
LIENSLQKLKFSSAHENGGEFCALLCNPQKELQNKTQRRMFINKKCNLENNEATCNGLLLRNLETQQIIENKIDFFVRLKIWLPIEVRQPGRCLALLSVEVNIEQVKECI